MAISSAAAVIDVRVNNLRELNKLETGTRRIQDLFNSLQQRRNIFDQSVGSKGTREASRNLRSLIKGFAEAKAGAREFRVEVEKTTKEGVVKSDKRVRMYSKTLAGLGSQLQTVDKILANSTVGQEDFNNALAVSNKLQRELVRNQLAAAGAEAKAGAGSAQGLIALGKELPNSVKALELYQAELNDLQRTVDRTSQDFFELGKEIERVDLLLGRGPRQGQGPRGQGGRAGKGTGKAANILQGAILGGGFPLLFGGPSFSAVGGLVGGGAGGAIGTTGKFGFAGGIAGSVIGSVLDGLVKAAVDVGKALQDPIKNLQTLVDLLPIAGTETKGLIRELQDLGLDATASAVAVESLNEELGDFGVKDIEKFKEQIDTFDNAMKRLNIAAAGFASNKLIGFIEFLATSLNLFNRAQGQGTGGGMLGRAAGFAIAQGELADEGQLPGQKPPQPPQATTKEETQLTQDQVEAARRAEQIRQAQIVLAGMEFKIEQDRLKLVRGDLGIRQAQLRVAQASLEFSKADLEFSNAQTDADVKRLGLKKALAEAELIQARAAEANAVVIAKQLDAAFQLERAIKNQAIGMADLNAEIAAQQSIRAASPFANESFLLDPITGGSRKLESEQNLRFAETLRVMNAELANVNKNIEFGTELDQASKLALVDKKIELENNIARYKEYQPAIDEAALAQARFNEALAIATPITNDLFDSITSVVQGTKTAEQAFADFLKGIASMLADAAKQIIATYIAIGIARLFAGVPAGGGGTTPPTTMPDAVSLIAGKGAALGQNGVIPFAKGGIVNKPSLFRFGSGGSGKFGLMGEAGPEAIMPLRRGPGGVLGVEAHGGGGGNITVNVDASGSSVEGNGEEAAQLGKAIGVAVQQELIKQKRPGGLLA